MSLLRQDVTIGLQLQMPYFVVLLCCCAVVLLLVPAFLHPAYRPWNDRDIGDIP